MKIFLFQNKIKNRKGTKAQRFTKQNLCVSSSLRVFVVKSAIVFYVFMFFVSISFAQKPDSIVYYKGGKDTVKYIKEKYSFYENGKIDKIYFYSPNRVSLRHNGVISFYFDGKKQKIKDRGVWIGRERSWDEQGRITSKGRWHPSNSSVYKFVGVKKMYNDNGTLLRYEFTKGYKGGWGNNIVKRKVIKYDSNGKVIAKEKTDK